MISAVLELPDSVILTLPSSAVDPAGPRHSKKTFSGEVSTWTSRHSLVPTLCTASSSSLSENTGWDILCSAALASVRSLRLHQPGISTPSRGENPGFTLINVRILSTALSDEKHETWP